ncbi:MAG: cellulase [Succinivibrionaceae bacterium]|nr:cellulase [Succinivibrionaceae bacterium]
MAPLVRALLGAALGLLALQPLPCGAWALWDEFKSAFLSEDGRVIDHSDERAITTSEGQSYALIFSIIANEPATFDLILGWTERNLAGGSLSSALPAWLWGRREDGSYGIIDPNSASDSDLFIAYALLEAARAFGRADYAGKAQELLGRVAERELAEVEGLGLMLLPGPEGFRHGGGVTLNPSYLPPMLLRRLAALGEPWERLYRDSLGFLLDLGGQRFPPDWISFVDGEGYQVAEDSVCSYNALRVYLWVGMMPSGDPLRKELVERFSPILGLLAGTGTGPVAPERIYTKEGRAEGQAPASFHAALLPFVDDPVAKGRLRAFLSDYRYDRRRGYYDYVISLFARGLDESRYRLGPGGELLPCWLGADQAP